MTPTRIGAALFVFTALTGCMDDGYEQVDESCNGNVECPIYWVCNRVTRTCEYEAANRFMGTMACEYAIPAGAEVDYAGASDIAAWLGLEGGAKPTRTRTNLMAWCGDAGDGVANFNARGLDSTGTEFGLTILLPQNAGAFEVVPPSVWTDWQETATSRVTARPPGFDEAGVIAEASHGIVVLDATPSGGAILSLYVDIVMQPTQ